jgi:hypothetical protein
LRQGLTGGGRDSQSAKTRKVSNAMQLWPQDRYARQALPPRGPSVPTGTLEHLKLPCPASCEVRPRHPATRSAFSFARGCSAGFSRAAVSDAAASGIESLPPSHSLISGKLHNSGPASVGSARLGGPIGLERPPTRVSPSSCTANVLLLNAGGRPGPCYSAPREGRASGGEATTPRSAGFPPPTEA